MSGKKPRMTFMGAVGTRNAAKAFMEEAGVTAKFSIVVSDAGPIVEIEVDPSELEEAKALLPDGADFANVVVKPATK